jgi:hypothetical protein
MTADRPSLADQLRAALDSGRTEIALHPDDVAHLLGYDEFEIVLTAALPLLMWDMASPLESLPEPHRFRLVRSRTCWPVAVLSKRGDR